MKKNTCIIPTELLMQIVTYLEPNDKRMGMLICKEWYQVFRYSLYHTIFVKNKKQLMLLLTSLTSLQRTNGYFIKHIYIRKRTTLLLPQQKQQSVTLVPPFLFEQLPILCPNLETLDFDSSSESWKSIYFHDNISKWIYIRQLPTLTSLSMAYPFLHFIGERLRHLSIKSDILVDLSTQGRLVSILTLVPNITSLEIKGDEGNSQVTLHLTIDDIEIIHNILQRLKRLYITGDRIQLHINQSHEKLPLQQQIKNFLIAPNLESLCFNTRFTSAKWLFYIAHKYPNLHHLIIDVQYDDHDHDHDNQQELNTMATTSSLTETLYIEKKALFLNLIKRCCHLETISLSCPTLSHWFNSEFFEILKERVNSSSRCSSIKKVQANVHRNNQIKFDSEFRLALQYGKDLITSLEIDQWRLNATLSTTLNSLKGFSQLSYLEMKCDSYHDEYDMKVLLNNCPVLETLVIEWGTLYVSDLKPKKTTRYPLRALYITFVSFTPHVFHYLSKVCPLLNTLYITKCKQLCNINNTLYQTMIEIDMPLHVFDCIAIHGVRFEYSNASLFYHKVSSYVQIANIERCKNGGLEEEWYQYVGYKSTHSEDSIIQQLGQADSRIAEDYFVLRGKGVINTSSSNNSSSDQFLKMLSEQKLDDKLKMNLTFGYIKIRCKEIENFILNESASHFPLQL